MINWKKSYNHEITGLDSFSSSETDDEENENNLGCTTYSDNYTKDLLDYFNAHPAKNKGGIFLAVWKVPAKARGGVYA